MSHTIELPEDVYRAIAAYAAQRGQTPEEAIAAWVTGMPGERAESGEARAAEASVNIEMRPYTATELMKLPREERERILAAAAEAAEPDYREGGELTDFEAFGEDDMHDDYPE